MLRPDQSGVHAKVTILTGDLPRQALLITPPRLFKHASQAAYMRRCVLVMGLGEDAEPVEVTLGEELGR